MTDMLLFIMLLAAVLFIGTMFLVLASILRGLGDEIEEELKKEDEKWES